MFLFNNKRMSSISKDEIKFQELQKTLASLNSVIKSVQNVDEESPLGALKKVIGYYTDGDALTGKLTSRNFKKQDKRLLRQIGKSAFRGLVSDYDKRLRECESGLARGETDPKKKRWRAFEYNKIPLQKDYFIFIMLMLNAYLQGASSEVSGYVGSGICQAITEFFKQYTTYSEQYLPKDTGYNIETDPFKKRQGFFESFERAAAQDIDIPEVNYQTEIVEMLTKPIDQTLQTINNDLEHMKESLNEMIGTPQGIRNLSYDRIETLLLYDAKYELNPQGGFQSKPGIDDRALDENSQQVRKNINYLMTSDDYGVKEKREKFIKLRQQYLNIHEELKHYIVAIGQKWETLWSQYRQENQEDKRAEYCINLKKLVESYSNLIQSIYVHGRLPHMFPDVEVDVRAYEAFLGHKLRPEDVRDYSGTLGNYTEIVGKRFGTVRDTEKLTHKDISRQLTKVKTTIKRTPLPEIGPLPQSLGDNNGNVNTLKTEYLEKVDKKIKELEKSQEKFKQKRESLGSKKEYAQFSQDKQDKLKRFQQDTNEIIQQFYRDIGQIKPQKQREKTEL